MYRLTVDGVEVYMIVTRNVFSHRLSVYRKYDLKGSTVAREASDKEKFLAQLKLMDYSLLVGIHDVERAEQEEVECEENEEDEGESDGAHPVGTPPDSPGNTLNSLQAFAPGEFDPTIDVYGIKCHENAPRKEVYFMAIIDILTHYDAKKKAAHAAKTVKHGLSLFLEAVNLSAYLGKNKDIDSPKTSLSSNLNLKELSEAVYTLIACSPAGAEISTVNPEQYSKRFLDFIANILT
ncbi:hypothetical protein JD844_003300 [Phrynosoma platyrhinos]|uniref:Phosphatidylinositol 5-phosphate 4-kinase type-2 alpha n=1 Tax=Phrynosoma platyrhinos TaxID=52577 RepID=A0ABQ7TDE5_PHRPL|nr:hypothetical protein JD844_003300 [Phrynosoma platyrhinos]